MWLPLSRGEQYYHGILRRAGWRTYLPAPPVEDQLAGLDGGAEIEEAFDVDPAVEAAWARFEKQS